MYILRIGVNAMYTITLNDGNKIDGLTLKNNCLMSAKPLTAGMFVGK